MHSIPQYKTFKKMELVTRGWSGDRKYYIETVGGEKLLLRVSGIGELEKKKAEFAAMQKVAALGIPMSQPIDFGLCEEGKSVYSLLTWINGQEAGEILPTLAPGEQYALGIKAGQILRTMHTLPAPPEQEDWAIRFNRKIDRKIEGYKKCGIRIKGDDKILAYIEENRHLLNGRPQSFQHGDYHVGNMILSDGGALSIIDFNRFDYGDPWEEFNRIVWCSDCSRDFASGRIDGYFAGDVPEAFFRLLALYIASNTLSSIYWAIPFGQAEIDTMTRQATQMLRDYDDMKNPVPRWYSFR